MLTKSFSDEVTPVQQFFLSFLVQSWLSEWYCLNSLIIVLYYYKGWAGNFPISQSVSVTGLAMRINRLISVTQAVCASLNVCPQAPTNCCLTHYLIKKRRRRRQGYPPHLPFQSVPATERKIKGGEGACIRLCARTIFFPNGLNRGSAALLT